MTEEALQKEISRSLQAQRLLEDPLLVEAFEAIKNQYLVLWEATQPQDIDKREKLWHHVSAAKAVREHLLSVMSTGKLARHQMAALEAGRKAWFR